MADQKSPMEEKGDTVMLQTSASHSDDGSDKREVINLNSNPSGRVQNPLVGIPRATLLSNVERFAEEKQLTEHIEVLKRGALLAQDPSNYSTLPDLREDERAAIENEMTHKWSHPMTLYWTIITCSIGAATQGWDQTGSNGANLSFPQEFGILNDEWIKGIINAAPYIASALCGCWLSDPLNNYFGRRGCIFITALILIATPIGSGFTHSWEALFVVRLILGIGMGAKGST